MDSYIVMDNRMPINAFNNVSGWPNGVSMKATAGAHRRWCLWRSSISELAPRLRWTSHPTGVENRRSPSFQVQILCPGPKSYEFFNFENWGSPMGVVVTCVGWTLKARSSICDNCSSPITHFEYHIINGWGYRFRFHCKLCTLPGGGTSIQCLLPKPDSVRTMYNAHSWLIDQSNLRTNKLPLKGFSRLYSAMDACSLALNKLLCRNKSREWQYCVIVFVDQWVPWKHQQWNWKGCQWDCVLWFVASAFWHGSS